MRYFFYLSATVLAVFVLSNCTQTPVTSDGTKEAPQDTLIDFIKSHAMPRRQFQNMVKMHWDRKDTLQRTSLDQLLLRCGINNDTLLIDTHFRYIALDYEELNDLFLFTVAKYTRSCDSTELYHFTLDTKEHLLFSCTKIGSSCKDETTTYTSHLSYAKDGRSLIVNTRSDRKIRQNGEPFIVTDKTSTRYDFFATGTKSRLLHEAHKQYREL